MLNPQWLRTFSTLAEVGSFTRSADRLDLTQAAVSQHIRHLEEQLGPLLIRRPRQLELTPAGQALLRYCAEVNQADRRLRQELEGADAEHGEIALISPGSIGLFLYPLLLEMQKATPGLVVRHRFAPDSEVLSAVLENHYELGLLSFKPDDPRLSARLFAEEPLELVVPAGIEVHDWQGLERLGFIDHPDGQAMAGRLLSRRFPGNPGLRNLPLHGFSNQIGLILEPVARGLGFTVLPRYARQAFVRQAEIAVMECGAPVVDKLWLIHRAEWPLSRRAAKSIERLTLHISSLTRPS
ncbi:LysR family transcriptional regulator [Pseudomonas aeruginosa]|nr:LysR family transcriptional regulator [Pseudomonas aeruginosa]